VGEGYQILARNYREAWGELDIVAKEDDLVVFCEVKTNSRPGEASFRPELRINRRKAWQIIKSAKLFLAKRYPAWRGEWRIDVVAVTLDLPNRKAKIRHIKNAIADVR